MPELLNICIEFFKAGLFSIGGGLATIPFLTRIAETHPDWYTVQDLANMIAVAESTPGPIGVNVATYAGFMTHGVLGGILATLSLVLPSFLCILIIYRFWQKYNDNDTVQKVFSALRAAGLGLIAAACFTVFKNAVFLDSTLDIRCLVLFIVMLGIMMIPKLDKVHPLVYILAAAAIGVIFKL